MNVFIIIDKDGYGGESVIGAFLTLDNAINKAAGTIRIEEFSLDTSEWVRTYTTEGKRAALYGDGLIEI